MTPPPLLAFLRPWQAKTKKSLSLPQGERWAAALFCILLATTPTIAQKVSVIETEGPVTAIVETTRGVYAETERGTVAITAGDCQGNVCVTPDVIRGLPQRAPDGALPDGHIATAPTGDIRKAWYARPTERYAHCVLGDCIEGGSLVAELTDGSTVEFVLPDNQVFEDITPRIANLTGDGTNEVVTIRASQSGGAAVVVYGLRDGELAEIAASSENGQANRWLNIADMGPEAVIFVRTPHIGGRLAILRHAGQGQWQEANDIVTGVSNHVIGSRELNLSAIWQFDGRQVLALPTQDRRSLALIHQSERTDVAMPGPIDKAIAVVGNLLVTATEDGRLVVIEP